MRSRVAALLAAAAVLNGGPALAQAGALRVPVGAIYSSIPMPSPVLAGNDTSIIVSYDVLTPPSGFSFGNVPAMQAIVELEDAHRVTLQRMDPVPVPTAVFGGGTVQTLTIPVTVPSDAAGLYYVRTYMRAAGLGGTVAIGPRSPLMVIAGPDPSAKIASQVRANGSIEVGPRITVSSTGVTSSGSASGSFDSSFKTALQYPDHTLTFGTSFNASSRRVDPLVTLTPPSSGPINSPMQTTAPSPGDANDRFDDTVGLTTAQLLSLVFSGGESLRGLDAMENNGGWTYHTAFGFPQVGSSTTGSQEGDLFDLTRRLGTGDSVRALFVQTIDDVASFVRAGNTQPLDAKSGGLQWDTTLGRFAKLSFAGGQSNAQPLLGTTHSIADSAAALALNYAIGSSQFNVGYHNFGENFATGNTVAASSDREGGAADASLALSPSSALSLNYTRDDVRSAFSTTNTAAATYTVSAPGGLGVTMTLQRDRSLSPTSDVTTGQASLQLMRATSGGVDIMVNSLIVASSDAKAASHDGVNRSSGLTFSRSANGHNAMFGIQASTASGASGTAIVSGSAGYTFPLIGGSHGLDLTTSYSVTNNSSPASGSRVGDATVQLTFHLGSHFAFGIKGERTGTHDRLSPRNDQTYSALRATLGVTI